MITIEHDGYEITVYDGGYTDWGMRIDQNGETIFNNPCFLSNESYGFHIDEDSGEESISWTDDEWRENLLEEADSLLESAGIE